MPELFISYSRHDLDKVLALEQALQAHGVTVWRDQHSIRGGEQWPKAIGEALAACDAMLLAWSAHSAQTAAVEFEWNTALALSKKIIPWMLDWTHDATPLPAALKTFNWIKEPDAARAVARILQALPDAAPTDAATQAQVITQLTGIQAVEELEVLAQAKTLFQQTNARAGGHIIQASGNVTITESRHQLPLLLAMLAMVVIIALAAFYSASRTVPQPQFVPSPTVAPSTHLSGQVEDERGDGLPDATVTVDEITGHPAMHATTTSSGGFIIDKIPAPIGERVRIFVSKEGYVTMQGAARHDQYIPLPGPLPTVQLKRKK